MVSERAWDKAEAKPLRQRFRITLEAAVEALQRWGLPWRGPRRRRGISQRQPPRVHSPQPFGRAIDLKRFGRGDRSTFEG